MKISFRLENLIKNSEFRALISINSNDDKKVFTGFKFCEVVHHASHRDESERGQLGRDWENVFECHEFLKREEKV